MLQLGIVEIEDLDEGELTRNRSPSGDMEPVVISHDVTLFNTFFLLP
jgi:hypothetical protein